MLGAQALQGCSASVWFSRRLLDAFDSVPGHLTEDLHLYSLNDLSATKKGELVPRLTELFKAGTLHVERCMVSISVAYIAFLSLNGFGFNA